MSANLSISIKAGENTEYQTILELRCLCFKAWKQIAVDPVTEGTVVMSFQRYNF